MRVEKGKERKRFNLRRVEQKVRVAPCFGTQVQDLMRVVYRGSIFHVLKLDDDAIVVEDGVGRETFVPPQITNDVLDVDLVFLSVLVTARTKE